MDATIASVKKHYSMCHICQKHIVKGENFLLLTDSENPKEKKIICINCIGNITKEQWNEWGFNKGRV